MRGSHQPFRDDIVRLRPHPGALEVAAELRSHLQNSQIAPSHADCGRVQDAYSLRAAPQVHGATLDVLRHAERVLAVEFASVTDNPLILPDTNEVISGGNFHGQPLALTADALCVAMAELGSISERRCEQLLNPALSGLPGFLTPHGGLNSGLMIAQYTAAALVSENKVLCHPASVDSIPTSANQEDHVSHGRSRLPQAARGAGECLHGHQHRTALRRSGAGLSAARGGRRRSGRAPGDPFVCADAGSGPLFQARTRRIAGADAGGHAAELRPAPRTGPANGAVGRGTVSAVSRVQSFAWWSFAQPHTDPAALLRAAAEIGYAGVDLIGEALWPLAQSFGLRVAAVNGHASITHGLNDPPSTGAFTENSSPTCALPSGTPFPT